MKHYTKLRKIVTVFHSYGISLMGKGKLLNLYKDLNMDQVYIRGLIFELELALQIEAENEVDIEMTIPMHLIQNLVGK